MNHSRIDLAKLFEGLPGLTKRHGGAHYEAALICLEKHHHQSGVQCHLNSLNENLSTLELVWAEEITEQTRNSWNDISEATEWGAAGIAILVILECTEYTVIRCSKKGTGFDYWLGYKKDVDNLGENVLKDEARLEVSGILSEQKGNTVKQRVKKRDRQTKKSDDLRMPVYIVVVEFSSPVVYMVDRMVNG